MKIQVEVKMALVVQVLNNINFNNNPVYSYTGFLMSDKNDYRKNALFVK